MSGNTILKTRCFNASLCGLALFSALLLGAVILFGSGVLRVAAQSVPEEAPKNIAQAADTLPVFEQNREFNRLGQETDRSRTEHARFVVFVRKSRHEDHRDATSQADQARLKLDAADAWHPDVGDDAGNPVCADPLKKLLG